MPGLTLSRKRGQRILIGDDITVEVSDIDRGTVRLTVVAPRSVAVDRAEVRGAKKVEAAVRAAACGCRDDVREALDTPPHRRTPAQVERLQCSVYGCCDRHANNQGCGCMAEARAAEGGAR